MAKIQLNGKKIPIKSKLTIYDLLKKFKLNNKKVAIECNGNIIPKSNYNMVEANHEKVESNSDGMRIKVPQNTKKTVTLAVD